MNPGETTIPYSRRWPADWKVVWTVLPTTPSLGAGPQLEWNVRTEETSQTEVTYHIAIRNLTQSKLEFELRYAVLNVG